MLWFKNSSESKTLIEIEHLKAKCDRLESQIMLISQNVVSLRGLVNRKIAKIDYQEQEFVKKAQEEPIKEQEEDAFSIFRL